MFPFASHTVASEESLQHGICCQSVCVPSYFYLLCISLHIFECFHIFFFFVFGIPVTISYPLSVRHIHRLYMFLFISQNAYPSNKTAVFHHLLCYALFAPQLLDMRESILFCSVMCENVVC